MDHRTDLTFALVPPPPPSLPLSLSLSLLPLDRVQSSSHAQRGEGINRHVESLLFARTGTSSTDIDNDRASLPLPPGPPYRIHRRLAIVQIGPWRAVNEHIGSIIPRAVVTFRVTRITTW